MEFKIKTLIALGIDKSLHSATPRLKNCFELHYFTQSQSANIKYLGFNKTDSCSITEILLLGFGVLIAQTIIIKYYLN